MKVKRKLRSKKSTVKKERKVRVSEDKLLLLQIRVSKLEKDVEKLLHLNDPTLSKEQGFSSHLTNG